MPGKRARRWGTWVVIRLCWCLVLALGLCGGCDPGLSPEVVAKADGHEITLDDFTAQMAFMGLGSDPAALVADLRQAVLDSLVRRRLIIAQGAKLKLSLDSPEVLQALRQAHSGENEAVFQRNLAAQGLTVQQWERVVGEEILSRLIIKRVVADRILIPAAEIRAYYQANQERFNRPQQILAQHAVLPTRQLADKLLAEVAAGKDMGKAAAALGVPIDGGGAPAWLSRGHMPPELEKKVFALEQGKVAGPLASTYGFHVVRVIDKRPARRLTVAQAAPEIKQVLAAGRKDELATQWVANLLGKADVWFDPGFQARGRIGRTRK